MTVPGTGCPPRAVLLDPHPVFQEGLAGVLERLGIQVVGKARSANMALALLDEHEPDLFVAEIELAEGPVQGLWALRRACEHAADLTAVVVSGNADLDRVEAAFAVGATGYVLKTAQPDEMAVALQHALAGSVYVLGGMHGPLAHVRPHTGAAAPAAPSGSAPRLTRRELEVLRLVADGRSNRQVAEVLWVTEDTVKFHLANVYRKLGVSSRADAARLARSHGLLEEAFDRTGRVRLLASGTEG